MRRRIALGLVAVFLVLGVSALTRREPARPRSPRTPQPGVAVEAVSAQTGLVREVIRAAGSVVANQTVEVSSKIPGRVLQVFVREGDPVRRAQALLRLDPSDAEAQLQQAQAALRAALARVSQAEIGETLQRETTEAQIAQARAQLRALESQVRSAQANRDALDGSLRSLRANLAAAEANVRAAEANLERVRSDLARLEVLYAAGAVAAQQVEAARTQLLSAQSALDAARAQRDAHLSQIQTLTAQQAAAEAALEQARSALEGARAALRAAEAQRAQSSARRQDVLQAKAAVDQARSAVRLAEQQLQNTWIRSPLEGVVVQRSVDPGEWVAPGMPVLVVADLAQVRVQLEVSEREIRRVRRGQPVEVTVDALPGRVFQGRVTRWSEAASTRTRTFTVEVELPNPHRLLRPGMFGRGTIVVAEVRGAVLVPAEAVVSTGGRPSVWVVEGGRARLRPVRIGLREGGSVQVFGLRTGERVVVLGQDRLQDGVPVIVRP
ncbi:MAG: efflux RND transporter periplasmic adaptor subunit [Armatimonadota bacterium]|nr:efflux RND transporter periplasmic adaptor subunit [Armatimonadota bacterium]MDR7444291.1 efflux RND transporter periplasmic adaptor subunit [Armatimonadota bacterium]MDR7570710.1 efflux RND transporter periplasmic adaptor subunit [Armatimonadota bacterium]MDR7614778.1 efflux RND transporter periplasmic adaptor subunit [Armatimonadota bacterium]